MHEDTLTPAPTKASTKPAAPADETIDGKRTVTLTFVGEDLELYNQIVEDAEEDERTPSGLLLRFIRKTYSK
jgi:hypothetical protein